MSFDSLPNILEGAFGVFLIVLFFGGSIFIHELGHFLAARKRGLKIERFSIGFGPRLFGWTGKDGVDYRVSLLPLGGYVALPQMVDMEAIEGKNENDPEALPPISYADKMIVAVMGVVFNVLFAFAIACVLWVTGRPVPASINTTTIGYVLPELPGQNKPSPAIVADLRVGDKIIAVDSEPMPTFQRIMEKIALGSGRDAQGNRQVLFKINRDGTEQEIAVRPERIDLNPSSGDAIRTVGILPAADIIIEKPHAGSPAAAAGLKEGDEILALDGTTVYSIEHFKQLLSVAGVREVRLDVRAANGEKRTVALTPVLRTETVELAQITFADGTATRKLRFAPVPDDFLAKKTPTTERRNLVLFDTLPTTSAYAETLRPGAILSSVDLPTGIVAVRTPAELTQAAQPLKNGTATLFFKDAAEPLRLESFDATVLPAKKTPFIGISYSGRAGVVHQTPFEQVRIAFALTFESIEKLIDRNSDVGINHLMGAISIAKTYYNAADDIKHILWFTLIININLAILNILPFPVLDGGHILIATIQKIIGRPLPLKILAGVQYIFVALFLSLMAYVLLNDVKRCSGDNTLKVKNVIEQRYVRTDVSFAPTEK